MFALDFNKYSFLAIIVWAIISADCKTAAKREFKLNLFELKK